MSPQPTSHRSHDYRLLVKRWRGFAKQAGLKMRAFAKAGEHPVFVVTSPEARDDARETIYLSAGVHGDEPAPPWGLLEWAEENVPLLLRERFLIFPTLNPGGLNANTRVDHRGVDINRTFNHEHEPLIAAWREVLGDRKLSFAACLHEDYDGQGCYIYELTHRKGSVGDRILKETSRIIPADRRKKIDGRSAKDGLIIRRVPPELAGHPEAIVLHWLGAPITFTFESPSEFSFTERIAAQKHFIASSLYHVLGIS